MPSVLRHPCKKIDKFQHFIFFLSWEAKFRSFGSGYEVRLVVLIILKIFSEELMVDFSELIHEKLENGKFQLHL